MSGKLPALTFDLVFHDLQATYAHMTKTITAYQRNAGGMESNMMHNGNRVIQEEQIGERYE
jgi:hypothetical protein